MNNIAEDPIFLYAAKANADAIRKKLAEERNEMPFLPSSSQSNSTPSMAAPAAPQSFSAEEEYTKKYELHRTKRAKAFAKINELLSSPEYMGLPAHVIETRRKAYEAMIDERYPEIKPFNETPPAKLIMQEVPALEKKDDMLQNIREELQAASKISDKKDKMARIMTIVPKLIQSSGTGGSDALQPAEVILGAPESQTFFTWAAATGRDISSPATWISFFNDPKIQSSQLFQADPDSYLKKTKGVYNSLVNTRNTRVDRYREMTSDKWLKTNTGLKLFPKFEDADLPAETTAQQPVSQQTQATFDMVNGKVVRKDVLPSQTSTTPSAVQVPVPQPTAPRKRIKFVFKDGQLVSE